MYALHYSLVIPALLLGFDYIYGKILAKKYIVGINKCLSFFSGHTLEIYLSQTITVQYLINFSDELSFIETALIAVVMTSVISCILYYTHKLFYTIILKLS